MSRNDSEPTVTRCPTCGGPTIRWPDGYVDVTHARTCHLRDADLIERDAKPADTGRCPVCQALIDVTDRDPSAAVVEHCREQHPRQIVGRLDRT